MDMRVNEVAINVRYNLGDYGAIVEIGSLELSDLLRPDGPTPRILLRSVLPAYQTAAAAFNAPGLVASEDSDADEDDEFFDASDQLEDVFPSAAEIADAAAVEQLAFGEAALSVQWFAIEDYSTLYRNVDNDLVVLFACLEWNWNRPLMTSLWVLMDDLIGAHSLGTRSVGRQPALPLTSPSIHVHAIDAPVQSQTLLSTSCRISL